MRSTLSASALRRSSRKTLVKEAGQYHFLRKSRSSWMPLRSYGMSISPVPATFRNISKTFEVLGIVTFISSVIRERMFANTSLHVSTTVDEGTEVPLVTHLAP